MARSRVKRATKKKPLNLPSFLPGLRGSSAWHVRETKEGEVPHTLNALGQAGEMAIPMGDDPQDGVIRLHELLHAAHSPLEPPRSIIGPDKQIIERENLVIAEEFRLNLMVRAYVKAQNLPDENERYLAELGFRFNQFQQSQSPADWALILDWIMIIWPLMVGAFGTSGGDLRQEITDVFRDYEDPTTRELVRIFFYVLEHVYHDVWPEEIAQLIGHNETPSWDSVIKLATYLQRLKDDVTNLLTGQPLSGQPGSGEGEDGDLDPDLAELAARAGIDKDPTTGKKLRKRQTTDDLFQRLQKHADDAKGETKNHREPGPHKWGPMKIVVAKLTEHLPKKLVSRSRYRGSDEGAVPRYVHRLPVDGKIFGRKKKVPGGSVLIDDSGSMSWTTQEIKDIMEAAPAVNIAAYSGHGRQGYLYIIGKNGQYADVDRGGSRPPGVDNLVDGPALEWLASMPKPRIWVSDTHITLLSGDIDAAYVEVFQLCKRNDINIVPTAEAAREVFEGKRVIYR